MPIFIKLLCKHISLPQFAGFSLANLAGMTLVLLGLQFYLDVLPLFTQGDSFMKEEYMIVTKRISTLGGLVGSDATFSKGERQRLSSQPFVHRVGAFTPSVFEVYASIGMEKSGTELSTAMFFEAVPDPYVDIRLTKWEYEAGDAEIPIILPRNYLNLYNFGFAQSRGLPKISEQLTSLIQMNIVLRGDTLVQRYKGRIVGFSSRLNTILVPQTFMDWANHTFCPSVHPLPARLIVEVNNPSDARIAPYFDRLGYEVEGNPLAAGKTTFFLRLLVAIVVGVGLFICALAFYLLMLSIFLLLQKSTYQIDTLLLIGYSPRHVSMFYALLSAALNSVVVLMAIVLVQVFRSSYLLNVKILYPDLSQGSLFPTCAMGLFLFLAIAIFNYLIVTHKIRSIWEGHT
ncbi:MAG: ABC transporter permease [Bacteroidaceae bacterium]